MCRCTNNGEGDGKLFVHLRCIHFQVYKYCLHVHMGSLAHCAALAKRVWGLVRLFLSGRRRLSASSAPLLAVPALSQIKCE